MHIPLGPVFERFILYKMRIIFISFITQIVKEPAAILLSDLKIGISGRKFTTLDGKQQKRTDKS